LTEPILLGGKGIRQHFFCIPMAALALPSSLAKRATLTGKPTGARSSGEEGHAAPSAGGGFTCQF
jgi:hypothetical protein